MTKTEILNSSAEALNASRLKSQQDLQTWVERLTRQQQHQSDDLVNSKQQTSEQIAHLTELVHKLAALN